MNNIQMDSAGQPVFRYRGFLVFVALWLLMCLKLAIEPLFSVLLDLQFTDISLKHGADPALPMIVIMDIAVALLVIWSVYLFFNRRKAFRPVAIVLMCLYMLSIAANAYSSLPHSKNILSGSVGYVVQFAIHLAILLYMIISKRVRETFIFRKGERDPYLFPLKQTGDTGALPVYGFSIMIALHVAIMVDFAYRNLISSIFRPHSILSVIVYVLIYGSFLALSIWCFILLFQRRKFFKWLFITLACLFLVLNIYAGSSYYSNTPEPSVPAYILAEFWVPCILYSVMLLYQALLVVYILVSKRVKRTFLFNMNVNKKAPQDI